MGAEEKSSNGELLRFLERKATEHKKYWLDKGRDAGVVPGPAPPMLEKSASTVRVKPDASGVEFKPKVVKKPTIAHEGAADVAAAAMVDAAPGGARLVGMRPGQMLPDAESVTVKGAVPPSPQRLQALREYFSQKAQANEMRGKPDGRAGALAELQSNLAKMQAQGQAEDDEIRRRDERVIGDIREEFQTAWKNADYNIEPQFGRKLAMALIAVFGGQQGAQIVSALIDADVREKENELKARQGKAKGIEDDLKGFVQYSGDAAARRRAQRLERMAAALKLGEAYINQLPNNEAKAAAMERQAELHGELATKLREMERDAAGEATVERKQKYDKGGPIYAGGGKKESNKELAKIKDEVLAAGREWRKAGMDKKQAALQEVLDVANEGVSETEQFALNQVMSNPGLANRVFVKIAGMPPAKQARAMQSVLVAQKEINGEKATELDALKNQLSLDFSAGAGVFKGQVNQFNSMVNDFVAGEGRGGRVFMLQREKMKQYAPVMAPPDAKAAKKIKR